MMVTIGLPIYNAEKFLLQAIDSVLNQTFRDFELIIVDDGSTDNSLEIVRSFNDARIILISDGANLGLPKRLNQISKLARGYYLARMDADDIMHPNRIEKQVDVLNSNKKIDVLGTNAFSINEDNDIVGIRLKLQDDIKLQKVSEFIHPTIMSRTEWFRNNPYDEKAIRIEDAELWFRTRKNNLFEVITEPLLYYREFGNKYYIKYFKGFKSVIYVLKKHSFSLKWLFFTIRYFLSGCRYYIYNIFNKEDVLILHRNMIKYKEPKKMKA